MGGKVLHPFSARVCELIARVPRGRVGTYGQIAALAGDHRAARQVARLLHSCSERRGLPWHRILGAKGRIALRPGSGLELQRRLLLKEGVKLDKTGGVDLARYLWKPELGEGI